MKTLSCSLALLAGVIGAGFSSGREIAYFFAAFGAAAPLSAAAACLSLLFLFLRLPAQMIRCGADTLPALCRIRFGRRFGRFCAGLFALLAAVTGGAMLAACAELFALTLPLRGAYPLGMLLSLVLGACLCERHCTARTGAVPAAAGTAHPYAGPARGRGRLFPPAKRTGRMRKRYRLRCAQRRNALWRAAASAP